jgi:hypothetical protein
MAASKLLMKLSVLDAMRLMCAGRMAFDEKCVKGFSVASQENTANTRSRTPLLTELMDKFGTATVSDLCCKPGDDTAMMRRRWTG